MGIEKTLRFFAGVYAGGRGVKIFGLLCSMLMLVASGCGQPTETGQAYYNPTWGADGRIYAIKEVIKTYRQGGLSPSTSQQRESYLVVMNGDGSNEQEIKFVGVERYPKLNASPLGNYLAMYRDGVEILDIHNGYAHIHTIEVDNTFFDWSPDEGKLVLQTSNGVELYTRDGVKVRDITNLRNANTWKYGDNILGSALVGDSSYRALASENDELLITAGDQVVGISYISGGEYYFGGGGSAGYRNVKTSDFSTIETYPTLNTELSKESGVYNIQVNPVDDGEVMYSKDPVSTNVITPKQGIYLIRLDGTNRRVLRR